ncbi:unnamed protein product [Schistosoma margrebowiei]|uniref:Uncharacterized protein n=1 Tax=Schistosoma margrebowiei TaxID=48269 RepID=A0A183MVA2_9TREM|nr:unnamed protein product [Schistosoma margrebowiei]
MVVGGSRQETLDPGFVLLGTPCNNQITIDGEVLNDVKTFTYLGNIIDAHGGSDADVKVWIGEARATYLQFKKV